MYVEKHSFLWLKIQSTACLVQNSQRGSGVFTCRCNMCVCQVGLLWLYINIMKSYVWELLSRMTLYSHIQITVTLKQSYLKRFTAPRGPRAFVFDYCNCVWLLQLCFNMDFCLPIVFVFKNCICVSILHVCMTIELGLRIAFVFHYWICVYLLHLYLTIAFMFNYCICIWLLHSYLTIAFVFDHCTIAFV